MGDSEKERGLKSEEETHIKRHYQRMKRQKMKNKNRYKNKHGMIRMANKSKNSMSH
jgi:hypothetical protein